MYKIKLTKGHIKTLYAYCSNVKHTNSSFLMSTCFILILIEEHQINNSN